MLAKEEKLKTIQSFENWLKSALRKVSMRWPPIASLRKSCRVGRGLYQCNGYGREGHTVPLTSNGKPNTFVDHVDPVGSFKDWDTYVHRLFCSPANLQLLCAECHNLKTKEERFESKKANQETEEA